jgi:hypothetical protein
VVELLPGKCKALSSNPSTEERRKKRKERKGRKKRKRKTVGVGSTGFCAYSHEAEVHVVTWVRL